MNKIKVTLRDEVKLKLMEMQKLLAGINEDEFIGEGINPNPNFASDCAHCDGVCEVTCSIQCKSSCVVTCTTGCGNNINAK